MWACGCGGCVRVCDRGGASALGYNRRSERIGVPITRMRVCARACARDFLWLRPVRPHVRPLVRGGRGPHARAVRGRFISSTKVQALPESLGQCKLLETLCVPRPPPPRRRARSRRCRRCAAARGAAAPGTGPHQAAFDAAALVLPVVGRGRAPRAHGCARGRPARVRGGPKAARRGRTVLAADGRRVAEPRVPVSARAAALTPARPIAPARGGRAVSARTSRARLGTCVHA